jgi:hypothetical protein
VLDTAGHGEGASLNAGDKYGLEGRSLVVLRTRRAEEAGQPITAQEVEALRKEPRRVPQPPAVPLGA